MTLEHNTIRQGDALEQLRSLPDESVGLIWTSPPFNLRNSSSSCMKHGFKRGTGMWNPGLVKGYDGFDDCLPHAKYVRQQRAVLTECLRVLNPKGAIFYHHRKRVQNGVLQDRSDILAGFNPRQEIIWDRCSSVNFSPGFFLPSHDYLWLIPKHRRFRLKNKANHLTTVWRIPPETRNPHPAPQPVELVSRCIRSSVFEGIVLDPYGGSGTTAIACEQLGVPWLLFEQSPRYISMARARIGEHRKQREATDCRDTRQGNS